MNTSNRIVLLSPPEGDFTGRETLKFRLIYDGPLQPSQRDPENGGEDPIALHKHKIRKVFHGQLKRLWNVTPLLGRRSGQPFDFGIKAPYCESGTKSMAETIADLYQENGFRFVPLVREDWSLLCSIDILFLRRDIPGSVIQAGDIDNRLKTLIDALRKPCGATELGGCTPDEGEDPFYCLLEDDKNVTSVSVETDTLLDPLTLEVADNRRVRLVISIEIKPYHPTGFNSLFG